MNPGDFVFLLGFPGHTMRYAPSPRLAYAADIAVPGLVTEFGRKLVRLPTSRFIRNPHL